MPEDSTSDRVRDALSRVRNLNGTNEVCLAAESTLARTGDQRSDNRLDVYYESIYRSPQVGVFSVWGEAYIQDLSIQEVRRWFINARTTPYKTDYREHIHPDCIAELKITSADVATTTYTAIKNWYHDRYPDMKAAVDDWFDTSEDEDCDHHWHNAGRIAIDVVLDGNRLDEYDLSEYKPDMRCCNCDEVQSWDEVTDANDLYDLLSC